jgi:hypothetical protein
MSWSSKSVGLVHHAVDMSCGQTCTHAMVSLSVNWLQKIEAHKSCILLWSWMTSACASNALCMIFILPNNHFK